MQRGWLSLLSPASIQHISANIMSSFRPKFTAQQLYMTVRALSLCPSPEELMSELYGPRITLRNFLFTSIYLAISESPLKMINN